MKYLALLILLTHQSFGQAPSPITHFVNHLNTTKSDWEPVHKGVLSGMRCNWGDYSCVEDQFKDKELSDAQSVYHTNLTRTAFAFQSKNKTKPCDRVCSTLTAANIIDLQLKLAEKIRLSEYFAYKELPSGNTQANLIRGSEDFYTYLLVREIQRSLKNLYPQLDFNVLPDSELKRRVIAAPARFDSLHTAELYKGRVFDSLSEEERLKVYQNVVKRKPPQLKAEATAITEFLNLLKKLPK